MDRFDRLAWLVKYHRLNPHDVPARRVLNYEFDVVALLTEAHLAVGAAYVPEPVDADPGEWLDELAPFVSRLSHPSVVS